MPGRYAVDVAAATHVGHVRQRNEDCLVVAGAVLQADDERIEWSGGPPVVVAALDGLGGHPDGDVASQLAGTALAAVEDPSDLSAAILAAHRAVLAGVAAGAGRRSMGATVVAAAVLDDAVVVGSAGDSLGLRVVREGLELLNPPDSGPRGELTSFAGDTWSPSIAPHVRHLTREEDVRLLLCTDGLTDVLPAQRIHELARDGPVADVVRALVDATLERGAHDNVTVVVVDVAAA